MADDKKPAFVRVATGFAIFLAMYFAIWELGAAYQAAFGDLLPWILGTLVLWVGVFTAVKAIRFLNLDQLSFSTICAMTLAASVFVGLNCRQWWMEMWGWPIPIAYEGEVPGEFGGWYALGIALNGVTLIALLFCLAYGLELRIRGREKNDAPPPA